jgi:hypothetical protein
MPRAHRVAAVVAVLGLLAAGLTGCISGPAAHGSGGTASPVATPTPRVVSTVKPWPTHVARRPAPRLSVPHDCPAATSEAEMVAEARAERAVLKTLRVCSDADHVVVINAGPFVWVIDSPVLTDNRKPTSFAATALHKAVVTRYAGQGTVPILPGEEIGLSGVEATDLHLRLDADISSLWLIAAEVSASIPSRLTDQATGTVRRRTAGLVADCSLKALRSSINRLTPEPSNLRLAQLLTTSARSACRRDFAQLDRSIRQTAPGATPVGDRLTQRAATLRLSRPTATAEAWAIRFLRYITTFGAHAA